MTAPARSIPRFRRPARLWPLDVRALPVFLSLSAVSAAFTLGYLWNTDLWWYLASGDAILDRGSVPTHDIFVYALPEPAPWVTHSWLWTVFLAAVNRGFGLEALPVLQTILVWGLLALAFTRGRVDRFGVVNALLVAGILAAGATRLALRAELPGWILWCVFIVVFERSRFGWRSAVLLVLLQWLWANLHGGYVLGVVPALAYAVGGWAQVCWQRRADHSGSSAPTDAAQTAPLWMPVALLLVPLLAPPFAGLRAEALWADLVGLFSGEARTELPIIEWQGVLSWKFQSLRGLYALLVLVGASGFVVARAPRSWPRALVFVGSALLPILAVRFLVGLAITAAMVVIYNVSDARRRVAPKRSQRPTAVRLGLPAALAAATCAAFLAITTAMWRARGIFEVGQSGDHFFSLSPRDTCPAAADFILAHDLPGPIFNDMELGGYLATRLHLTHRIFIDSRILDVPLLQASTHAQRFPKAWRQLDARHGFHTVVVSNLNHPWSRLPAVLTKDPDWELVYVDPQATVFVRAESGHEALREAEVFVGPAPTDVFLKPQPAPGFGWARFAAYNVLRAYPDVLLRNYLEVLLELERPDEVAAAATLALAITGDEPIWRVLRGRARSMLGRYEEASEDFAEVVRRTPRSVWALREHAVVLNHLGRRTEALKQLDRAFALDPTEPGVARLRRQLRAEGR